MTALAESVATDLRAGHEGAWPAVAVGRLADAAGDPGLIRQVWENLIGNAVKFSANRPDAQVSVESQAAAGEVIYHVRDNGIGFDMASSSEERDIVQGYHLGVNSYIAKPVDFASFQRAIEEVGLYWMVFNMVPGASQAI